mmetsp:Transcript_95239/g.269059  ORF Transcript_95239/g.269059 Transcript_95239/m.269059 type:complete len:358 (+) Transcript_95239:97-1170(+)
MATRAKNQMVGSEPDFDKGAPSPDQVHVLICALDYKGTGNELTCTLDGNNMQTLCRACGIQDMQVMYDNECTKENVSAKIQEMGQRVGEDDYFIFYYSGHGTSMQDTNGDEADGMDEALCFVGPGGQLAGNYFMSDDEFTDVVTEAISEDARILILTDCCHSGTIGDLDKDAWEGRQVITITGCTDTETSGDIGKGGIFTHSMLLAIDHLQQSGEDEYSVGLLYNATVHEDDEVFHSQQDITLNSSHGIKPKQMAWPLIPQGEYKAPLNQAVSTAATQAGASATAVDEEEGGPGADAVMQMLLANPALLQQFGLSPAMAQNISGIGAVAQGGPNQDFLNKIQHADGLLGQCGACSVQ